MKKLYFSKSIYNKAESFLPFFILYAKQRNKKYKNFEGVTRTTEEILR